MMNLLGSGHWIRQILRLVLVTLCMLGGSGRALAQDRGVAGFESTQFLVIVDDSKSMRKDEPTGHKHQAADPNRLAVMSARLFGYLLGENDTVLVIGLNELAGLKGSAEALLKRHPLLSRTDSVSPSALSRLDANGSGLAAYDGDETPCQSALTNARELLNTWHGQRGAPPKARQVVLFLTDGKCEGSKAGPSETPVPAASWLKDVYSYQADSSAFRFFLLKFENRNADDLDGYASGDVGAVFGVKSATDVKGLVKAFVGVITEAKGYPALFADEASSRSFARASEVRVLSIREGSDARPLGTELELAASEPRPTQEVVQPKTSFRRAEQQSFDYQVERIVPNSTRFRVKPAPGSFAILIPDYRQLQADLRVVKGACGSQQSVKNHETYLTGNTEACLEVSLMAFKNGALARLSQADDLQFEEYGFNQRLLPQGSYAKTWSALTPEDSRCMRRAPTEQDGRFDLVGRIKVRGAKTALVSQSRPFDVGTTSWKAVALENDQPATRINLGTMKGNETKSFQVRFTGRFSPGHPLDLALKGDLASHPCIIKDIRGPNGQEILPVDSGQDRLFQLSVKGNCAGPGGRVAGVLLIASSAPDLKPFPQEIPIQVTLELPSYLEVWGLRIAYALAGLWALITLACIINGFLVPHKSLPPGKKSRSLYLVADAGCVGKLNSDFKQRTEKMAAYPIDPHISGGGWYRNGSIRLGQEGCRLPAYSPAINLELQEGAKFLLVGCRTPLPEIFRITDPSNAGREDGRSKVAFGKPAATLAVGPLCRVYARLLGRLPAVQSIRIDEGRWYAVAPAKHEPSYYFKVDVQPS